MLWRLDLRVLVTDAETLVALAAGFTLAVGEIVSDRDPYRFAAGVCGPLVKFASALAASLTWT